MKKLINDFITACSFSEIYVHMRMIHDIPSLYSSILAGEYAKIYEVMRAKPYSRYFEPVRTRNFVQIKVVDMASLAASLSRALPKPRYTGEEEEIPQHAQQRGPRILGAGALEDNQLVLKVCSNSSASTL